MAHSVEEHLHLQAVEYDRIIRTFIPHYDVILQEIVRWLGGVLPEEGKVIDLGGGTGSLAEGIAERFTRVQIEIRDTDPKMLEIAKQRLSGLQDRVRFVEKSFLDPLPECNAVVATLALHHVRELEQKADIYRNIFKSLKSPGIFLNGDCTMSHQKNIQEAEFQFWSDFMKGHGMTEEEVRRHFAEWKEEDTYFSLSEEFSALRSAGFQEPECYWKYGPLAIYGGVKQ